MNLKMFHSDYCNALERIMECYNTFGECYTSENLKKFKAASLELSVQLIGTVSDETEDMFQDCPIYTDLVGMRNSTKMMWIGISVGIFMVVVVIASFIIFKKSKQPRYSQTATTA